MPDIDDAEDDDDIVPGPLDEEDEGIAEEDDVSFSDSDPGEDQAQDLDDGDPLAPLKPPFIEPS
jgi:hypothetical protein